MATQCGFNNAVVRPHGQQFVSSSVYYGFVPLRLQDDAPLNEDDPGMDVDVDGRADLQQQRQVQQLLEDVGNRRSLGQRKRSFGHDDLAAYVPCFKRFRKGDCLWAEEHGLAQVYHEPSLLRLSPAADFDMTCQPTMVTGNLKFQSATLSKNVNTRSQELEDMLLLTHGCSSYHHYRQIQLNQISDSEEAEF